MKRSICLIGFMGSGKTTIGQKLAEALGYRWVDMDQYIEAQEGCTIVEIFKQHGEAYFRRLEYKYLKELVASPPMIISTGGGAITTPENISILQEQYTFYLSYPFEVLYKRIAGDEKRPLATNYEEILQRYQSRQEFYKIASYKCIDCLDQRVEQVVDEIISILKKEDFSEMENSSLHDLKRN